MKRDQHNNPNFLFCHHCPTPPDPTGSLLHLNQHVMNHSLPSSHCFCLAERGQGDGRPCRITEPSKRPLKCSPPPPPPPSNCYLHPSYQTCMKPPLPPPSLPPPASSTIPCIAVRGLTLMCCSDCKSKPITFSPSHARHTMTA